MDLTPSIWTATAPWLALAIVACTTTDEAAGPTTSSPDGSPSIEASSPHLEDAHTPPPPTDAGADPRPIYNGPTQCTSTVMGQAQSGPYMQVGQDCQSCHNPPDPDGGIGVGGRGGPFSVAGTIYPTLHEPDFCYGVHGGGLSVIVTDSKGTTVSIPVNESGNFYYPGSTPGTPSSLFPPLQAGVTDGVRTRWMASNAANGNCNGCHTEQGDAGAPGRIVEP